MDVWLAAAERQRTHGDLVNLSAGQPGAGAPAPVLAAAERALRSGSLGYSVALGIPELREAIARSYNATYGIDITVDEVVLTTGSSGGFLLAFLACFDVGDRVAIASPGYPCYRNMLSALGCEVVEIECGPDTRFQPTTQMLDELDPPVKGVVVASPANPTGTVIPPAELAAIANWCDARDVRLISDEVYHGLVYPGAPETSCAWQTSRNAVVVNSFSKYFAMTGWRLGWLVLPDDLTDRVKKLSENLFVSPPTISQHLAYKIFDHLDELNAYVETYRKNREILLSELPKAGFTSISNADGAFYVYADVHHLTNDSEDYCHRMLNEAKVSTTPGLDFDVTRGHGTIRICYADKTEDIVEACERLKKWQG